MQGQTNKVFHWCLPSQISCFQNKTSLKCGGKFNLILITCSLKLKSSNVCVLIDSIFVIGGKLLFSTNSDNFVCSFFLSVIILIGVKSSGHFFVLSFTLSILHRVFLTLFADTTLCRYPNVPTYCCTDALMYRHTNAPTLHCFYNIYVKQLMGPWCYISCFRKIENLLTYSQRKYLLNLMCWSEQRHSSEAKQ